MRVLLVVDKPHLASTLKRHLGGSGHSVDLVTNGVDGLWYASEHEYDVIVLDVTMAAALHDHDVCKQLRAQGDWTPILLLTERDEATEIVAGLDAGADDYVIKPFDMRVLMARLRSLARRNIVERPTVVIVDGLRLDPAARTVSRRGVAVTLTHREFAVLEFLMRNEGSVMRKSQILGAVWGFAFDGDPNIVEVYMWRLRRKIDTPFGLRSIETLRGSGYRMRAVTPTHV